MPFSSRLFSQSSRVNKYVGDPRSLTQNLTQNFISKFESWLLVGFENKFQQVQKVLGLNSEILEIQGLVCNFQKPSDRISKIQKTLDCSENSAKMKG